MHDDLKKQNSLTRENVTPTAWCSYSYMWTNLTDAREYKQQRYDTQHVIILQW